MVIELDKKRLRELYGGNCAKMIAGNDFIVWTPDRIKSCFNFGNGTEKDLHEYMKNNRTYCLFNETAEIKEVTA